MVIDQKILEACVKGVLVERGLLAEEADCEVAKLRRPQPQHLPAHASSHLSTTGCAPRLPKWPIAWTASPPRPLASWCAHPTTVLSLR